MSYAVYTDLDGTLLDHHSYSYQDALPALKRLQEADIPVIPVTSKTRAELASLRSELNLDSPFIVENGAAVFIPSAFHADIDGDGLIRKGGYWVKAFAPDMAFWSSLIAELSAAVPDAFKAMSSMAAEDVQALTGLSEASAKDALTREYSDPLHWLGTDEQLVALTEICAQKDIQVVKGGRFVHLLKGSDKGRALQWLNSYLAELMEISDLESIALGDGENDLAMLAKADIAVQIKSPVHDFPVLEKPTVYRTENYGPAGWAEAIIKILNSSPKESNR